jgi:predicted DNA-binding protein
MTKKTQPYTMRMLVSTREALEKLAAAEHRSVANYLKIVLSAHVEAKAKQGKRK